MPVSYGPLYIYQNLSLLCTIKFLTQTKVHERTSLQRESLYERDGLSLYKHRKLSSCFSNPQCALTQHSYSCVWPEEHLKKKNSKKKK